MGTKENKMDKEVVYKLISLHLGKVILNRKEFIETIKTIETKYEKESLEKLYIILERYKESNQYLEVDEYIIKAFKTNFNISKKELLEKMVINNKVHRVFFEYLNEAIGLNHSFDILQKNQTDLLSRLEFLGYDYNLIIKKQTMTLQSIGDEYGYTRERIRQKINETKKYLTDYISTLNLNYIYYEDVQYLSNIKKAIVFSDDENKIVSLGMYVFDKDLKFKLEKVMEQFKSMFIAEDSNIDLIYGNNPLVIKRYIYHDKGFYEIENKVYSLYTEKGLTTSKYIMNFFDENKVEEFTLNKQIVDKFNKSLHGQLYEEDCEKKLTQTALKKILVENAVIKLSGEKYLYVEKLNKWMEEHKYEVIEKLEQHLPIESKKEFETVFKKEVEEVGLERFYYLLKREQVEDYNFSKYHIKN